MEMSPALYCNCEFVGGHSSRCECMKEQTTVIGIVLQNNWQQCTFEECRMRSLISLFGLLLFENSMLSMSRHCVQANANNHHSFFIDEHKLHCNYVDYFIITERMRIISIHYRSKVSEHSLILDKIYFKDKITNKLNSSDFIPYNYHSYV